MLTRCQTCHGKGQWDVSRQLSPAISETHQVKECVGAMKDDVDNVFLSVADDVAKAIIATIEAGEQAFYLARGGPIGSLATDNQQQDAWEPWTTTTTTRCVDQGVASSRHINPQADAGTRARVPNNAEGSSSRTSMGQMLQLQRMGRVRIP